MARSNERMVSSGRSHRGLVGLERSGSAAPRKSAMHQGGQRGPTSGSGRTDRIAIDIDVPDGSEGAQSGGFEGSGNWQDGVSNTATAPAIMTQLTWLGFIHGGVWVCFAFARKMVETVFFFRGLAQRIDFWLAAGAFVGSKGQSARPGVLMGRALVLLGPVHGCNRNGGSVAGSAITAIERRVQRLLEQLA